MPEFPQRLSDEANFTSRETIAALHCLGAPTVGQDVLDCLGEKQEWGAG